MNTTLIILMTPWIASWAGVGLVGVAAAGSTRFRKRVAVAVWG